MARVIFSSPPHGMVGTPEYNSWRGMIERCESVNHKQYHRYGGRGIRVCRRWRLGFASFYADMGGKPSGHTLERKHNDRGYSPVNCIWATRKQQGRNKSNNRHATIDGVTKTLAEWCEERGINATSVLTRVARAGFTIEAAIATPFGLPKRTTHWLTCRGETMSITDWARRLGTTRATLGRRLACGATVEETLTRPIKPTSSRLTLDGVTKSLSAWCRQFGLQRKTVSGRLERGWSLCEALKVPLLPTGQKRLKPPPVASHPQFEVADRSTVAKST